MTTHNIELRKTHKYVGAYKHLDQHDFVATARIIATGTIESGEDDPCEGREITYLLRLENVQDGFTCEQINQAIKDSFSSHGCGHEYDCCGCRSHYAHTVKKTDSDLQEYRVEISSSRNY